MDPVTRRGTLALGAGALAATALPRPTGAAIPRADIPPPRLPIEPGANLAPPGLMDFGNLVYRGTD